MTPWRWLRRLAGPLVALLGVLVGAFYRWRAARAKAKQLEAERNSTVWRAGRDHEIERVERREEVIDDARRELEAARVAAGKAALDAAEAGDARPAGVLLRDVLRDDAHDPDPGGEPVRPGAAPADAGGRARPGRR